MSRARWSHAPGPVASPAVQREFARSGNIGTIQALILQYTAKFKQPPPASIGLRALITKNITSDEDLFTDPWGEPVIYKNPGQRSKDKFDVFSKGKDRIEGTDDDIGNWSSTAL